VSEETPRESAPGLSPGCFAAAGTVVLGVAVAYYWRAAIGLPLAALAVFVLVRLFRRDAERGKAYEERRTARFAAVGPPVGDAWRALLVTEGLADWVPVVEPHVRPAVRLTTTPATELPLGRSRIGGAPDLPARLSWPKRKKGSLAFLAQIDLEEAASHVPDGLLPRSGYLWFFHDTVGWGGGEYAPNDGGGPIVFYEPGRPMLASASVPGDLPRNARFPQCAVTMAAYEDIPDTDASEELSSLFSEDDDKGDRYCVIEEYLSGATMGDVHKLLGCAHSIQGAMETECQQLKHGIKKRDDARLKALEADLRHWRLLLQVESDPKAGMMWGDAGRLYFWIHDDDLRAGRFDQTVMIMQCH
jgi:uncharacterized protein YwqG